MFVLSCLSSSMCAAALELVDWPSKIFLNPAVPLV